MPMFAFRPDSKPGIECGAEQKQVTKPAIETNSKTVIDEMHNRTKVRLPKKGPEVLDKGVNKAK